MIACSSGATIERRSSGPSISLRKGTRFRSGLSLAPSQRNWRGRVAKKPADAPNPHHEPIVQVTGTRLPMRLVPPGQESEAQRYSVRCGRRLFTTALIRAVEAFGGAACMCSVEAASLDPSVTPRCLEHEVNPTTQALLRRQDSKLSTGQLCTDLFEAALRNTISSV
ncbi:hypothetical protein N658DRAFT_250334 [Parathielavia hyrcaniae]|uniref:Uncharacterized protein n=1 Tax=Parathielavia hyrcaniae TaxID=113614 RepID=A0AAN6QBA3_9PEZI|nr:hypothetical protein N658DRAFT_250334 [Parathielavia hyrcaniae]